MEHAGKIRSVSWFLVPLTSLRFFDLLIIEQQLIEQRKKQSKSPVPEMQWDIATESLTFDFEGC